MARSANEETGVMLAGRVVAACEERFAYLRYIGHADEISSIAGIDRRWRPEIWCDKNAERLQDIFQLTTSVSVPAAAIVVATAMLEHHRFELARAWSHTFRWSDLVTIADAACERLPETI